MNIYFSGIGGVGIGPLAEIALDMGYRVQGSDIAETPLTQQLQARDVNLFVGHQDGQFLAACHQTRPIDWFVYTTALPHDHPELVRAQQLGLRVAKRDELLAHVITKKHLKLIAVAGTHGKTTTTGMLLWALQQQGIKVSYSIGTTLGFGPSGRYEPSSEFFVYECDEFDRNFLHFSPYVAIITSLDYDHPDTYPSPVSYTAAFAQFVGQSDTIIMWQTDASGITTPSPRHLLLKKDDEILPVQLAGAHNRRNGTLVVKTIDYLGLGSPAATVAALEQFPGTDRRFERLADNLYSDYAHHPVEIAATLQLAREISDHVIVVYQPHQNIRQHEIRDQYGDCFDLAEQVYWLPTYLSREDQTLPILSPGDLISELADKSVAHVADLDDTLWQSIQQARQEGKLVLAMGAGSIDSWLRDQLASTPPGTHDILPL